MLANGIRALHPARFGMEANLGFEREGSPPGGISLQPRLAAPPRHYGLTITGAPTSTRAKRSTMSLLCMRMQP